MLTAPPHLRSVVNQDGAAILDITHNQITTLNSTGGFVWDRLQRGWTVEQAIEDLAIESDTDPAFVEGGVRTFVQQLKSHDLLPR
jgi:hypothetical protein